ncbi:MAG: hypothetical protein M3137_08595 [Actinomycetota bacterium]|nr:hypothetical protein [Actinomycetota bacterium]
MKREIAVRDRVLGTPTGGGGRETPATRTSIDRRSALERPAERRCPRCHMSTVPTLVELDLRVRRLECDWHSFYEILKQMRTTYEARFDRTDGRLDRIDDSLLKILKRLRRSPSPDSRGRRNDDGAMSDAEAAAMSRPALAQLTARVMDLRGQSTGLARGLFVADADQPTTERTLFEARTLAIGMSNLATALVGMLAKETGQSPEHWLGELSAFLTELELP